MQRALDVHRELLSAEGMARARARLCRDYVFLLHSMPTSVIESVRTGGLQPHLQRVALDADAACIEELVGEGWFNILCLRIPERTFPRNDGLARYVLAVPTTSLSNRVGIDWSYGRCWGRAKEFRRDHPDMAAEEILMNVAKSLGSVAVYDGVPACRLRMRLESSPVDPATWPLFLDVDDLGKAYVEPGGDTAY